MVHIFFILCFAVYKTYNSPLSSAASTRQLCDCDHNSVCELSPIHSAWSVWLAQVQEERLTCPVHTPCPLHA